MTFKLRHLFLLLAAVGLFSIVASTSVNAIDPASFQPGRIIDDEVFYDKTTMSITDIQNFLNAHSPGCDTWGQSPATDKGAPNMTRAQWAAANGWAGPPYVCLRNYHENPTTGDTSFEKGGGWFSGGQSAAQIIWQESQTYNINPQVLLVTLRKESLNLFGDDWPLKNQYKYSMGYACPDSGPNFSASCNSDKAGFYKQVHYAAWQLRYYVDHMNTYNYQPGRWNTIQYSPQPSCGTKDVFIENNATASLYIYTPYTPNNASLNAYPGEAYCGAYGNRNFWYMFQEWFGSVFARVLIDTPLLTSNSTPQGAFTNQEQTFTFALRNTGGKTVDLGTMAIAGRKSDGTNVDFGSQHIVVQPYQTYWFTAKKTFTDEDTYTFWITNYRDGYGWSDSYPDSANSNSRRIDNKIIQIAPTLTTDLALESEGRLGSTNNVTFTVKNNSTTYPVNLGYIGAAIRTPSGGVADAPFDTVGALAPGSDYTYHGTFTPSEVGTYNMLVSSTGDGGKTWQEASYPQAATGNVGRSTFTVKPNPTLTQGPVLDITSPYVGETANATFKIKNFSDKVANVGYAAIAVRDPKGANVDIGGIDLSSLAAGQEYVFNGSRIFTEPGTYTAWISVRRNGVWDDTIYPAVESNAVTRRITFTVKPNPTLTQGPVLSIASPHAGEATNVSFKIKNYASTAVNAGYMGVAIRDPDGANVDLEGQNFDAIAAGQEVTFSGSKTFTKPGMYTAWVTSFYIGSWNDTTYPILDGVSVTRRVTFTVKPNPTLTQGPVLNITSPYAGETVNATFKIKNFSNNVANVGYAAIAVRDPKGANVDIGGVDLSSLSAGQEYTFNGSRIFTEPGTYTAWVSVRRNGIWDDTIYPSAESGAVTRRITFTVKPNPTLTQGPVLSIASPHAGEAINVSFKIKNYAPTAVNAGYMGVAIRDPDGANVDLSGQIFNTVAAGQEVTFSGSKTFVKPGVYTAWVTSYYNGSWNDTTYPVLDSGVVTRRVTFTVQ